jgi:hypothetical protein
MNFTNTDCVEIEVSDQWYCWEVHLKMRKRVCEQVQFKVYDQINLIKYKIKQEINR